MIKTNFPNKIINRHIKKINSQYKKNKFENALCLMSSMAKVQYLYNQTYKDDYLEEMLNKISIKMKYDIKHKKEDRTVLFYDGFGIDQRGLVQVYLKALVSQGYRVIYVTMAMTNELQPRVISVIKNKSSIICHYSGQNFIDKVKWLDEIFEQHPFSTAFLYTTPWDVSGIIAFDHLKNKCQRYQINLTDHAFWLGVNAFDFSIEFRNYGAAISRDFRKISEDKLLFLPYYPIIDNSFEFQGFPFNEKGKKIIFSGGAIYKTFDKANTFFIMVEKILQQNPNTIFLFASDQINNLLQNLITKYPQRVYWIEERKDLIKVLEHSYLYLNTYPISGALMLQYAAMAGCIPVTLRRPWDDDACGILRDEGKLGEIFDDLDSVLHEINRLIVDKKYYREKKLLLKNQVIPEKEFQKRLNNAITNPSMEKMSCIKKVNTKKYIESYKENLSRQQIVDAVINNRLKRNIIFFPDLFFEKIIYKLKKNL